MVECSVTGWNNACLCVREKEKERMKRREKLDRGNTKEGE